LVQCLDGYWFVGGDFDRGEPAEAVWLEAVGDAEEFVGDVLCNLAGLSVADDDAVNGADGETSAAVPVKKTSSAM